MWAWQTEKGPFTAPEAQVPLYLHSRRRRRLACLTGPRLIPITATSITIGRAGCRHRCLTKVKGRQLHISAYQFYIWQRCRFLLSLRISPAFHLHFYLGFFFPPQPVPDLTDWLTAKPRGYRGRVTVCDWASPVSIITNVAIYYRARCWRQQNVGDGAKVTRHVCFEENPRDRISNLVVVQQTKSKIRGSLYWASEMFFSHCVIFTNKDIPLLSST